MSGSSFEAMMIKKLTITAVTGKAAGTLEKRRRATLMQHFIDQFVGRDFKGTPQGRDALKAEIQR